MARRSERAQLLDELEATGRDPDSFGGRLLRTHEVAVLFQVSERAVTDWAARGRLPSVRTPGGHRRYPAGAVRELLDEVGLRSVPGRWVGGKLDICPGGGHTSASGPGGGVRQGAGPRSAPELRAPRG